MSPEAQRVLSIAARRTPENRAHIFPIDSMFSTEVDVRCRQNGWKYIGRRNECVNDPTGLNHSWPDHSSRHSKTSLINLATQASEYQR